MRTLVPILNVALLLLSSLHHGLSAETASTKIINGKKAKRGDFPYTVYFRKDGNIECCGILIEPQVVLTLNDCIGRLSVGGQVEVIVGDRRLNKPDGEVVASIYTSILNNVFNIGLVGLKEIMDTSLSNIGTIDIYPVPLEQDLWKKTTCFLASYGMTGSTEIKEATFKQKMKVRVVATNKCGDDVDPAIYFCYKPKNNHRDLRACLGDEGSAIMCSVNGQNVLVGINEERSCSSKFHRALLLHPRLTWIQLEAPLLRSCVELPFPAGGFWETSATYPYPGNTAAILKCSPGYRRTVEEDADATIACRQGEWTTTDAECVSVWNGLTVRFDRNPADGFIGMPRTVADATTAGWNNMDPSVACDGNPQLLGLRYWKNDDLTVILIFGPNGYIAGIATGMPRKYSPNPDKYPFKTLRGNPFIRDSGVFYLSAYFVDPARLCEGRSAEEFALNGTGDGLWIQNGTNPVANSIKIPDRQADHADTLWIEGPCFPVMGTHYWYNARIDMDCMNEAFPVFLLYSNGLLNAFGWALIVDLQAPEYYYEHPQKEVYGIFFDPVPTCLYEQEPISTLHMYFTDNPFSIQCGGAS